MTAVIERTSSPVATSAAPVRKIPGGRVLGTFQCVVVSKNTQRLEMLEQAAFDGGWSTVVCNDETEAWTAVKRQRFQMAIIDVDGVEDAEELKALAQEVSQSNKTLLMLCGNEGNGLEEIWARQLGSWLYLPGVTRGCDVASLCEQAVPVAEKLNGIRNEQVSC